MDITTSPETGAMSFHIQEMAQEHLSDEEQRALVRRVQENGDADARERLIVTNMKLALSIAQRYTDRGIPFDDILQECLAGLDKAILRYDAGSSAKFTTYATHIMRSQTTRATDIASGVVRIPVWNHERNRIIDKRRMALAQELGRMPDSEEIAESFRWQGDRKITEASIERNKRLFAGNRSVSLDAPFPGARIDRETVAADIIGSDEILPDEEAVLNERKQALEDALSALPRREEIAIRARYGMPREGLDLPVIRDGEEATFDEIAKVFGITHEGARYLVGSAKKRIATGTAPVFRQLREIVRGTGI